MKKLKRGFFEKNEKKCNFGRNPKASHDGNLDGYKLDHIFDVLSEGEWFRIYGFQF